MHAPISSAPALARGSPSALSWVLIAGAGIATVELLSGFLANSLVLLSDAGHYAVDLVAIGLAVSAARWTRKPVDESHSYGHARGEVLAAFGNSIVIWGLAVFFVIEAYLRLLSPPAVSGPLVLIIGAVTAAANVGVAAALRRIPNGGINVRGAYLHLFSDAAGSVSAAVAGALIWFGRLPIADPIATLFVAVLLALLAFRLTRDSVHILLEGTPVGVDPSVVEAALRGVPTVRSVHDLHLWSLSSGRDTMSVHVVLDGAPGDDRIVHEIEEVARRRFHIFHSTIQVEAPGCLCEGQSH